MDKRPELFAALTLSESDAKLHAEILKDRSRRKLTEPVLCRPAEEADLERIMLIVRQARNSLKKHRVDQWQGVYPEASDFRASMDLGECYVLTYDGEVAAVFCLSDRPEPGYDAITDGKWAGEGRPYCTIHRAAVETGFRGTGLSDRVIEEAEALALGLGAAAVRVDTHRHNKPMKALLLRRGYRYRGNVLCAEPLHDPRRQAFEKLLIKDGTP